MPTQQWPDPAPQFPAPVAGTVGTRESELRAILEREPLPTNEQSDLCDTARLIRFKNLDGAPNCPHEAFRSGWMASLAINRALAAKVPDSVIDEMVNRFLSWPLPKTFSPDCGISFDGRKDDQWNKNKTWPIGTNLLSGEEAKAMFKHALNSPTLQTAEVSGQWKCFDGKKCPSQSDCMEFDFCGRQPNLPTADQLWNNEAVMALNAELGLTMDNIVKLIKAATGKE